jgi:hypothetical protein
MDILGTAFEDLHEYHSGKKGIVDVFQNAK